MASNQEYLDYILEQLSEASDVTYRPMMGEYILYFRGKIVGGIYDDRFLVKPTKSAQAMMPDAEMELPYESGKDMLLVDGVENRECLLNLFRQRRFIQINGKDHRIGQNRAQHSFRAFRFPETDLPQGFLQTAQHRIR